MKHEQFLELIKRKVAIHESLRPDFDAAFAEKIDIKDVFIVWSCKTLQNSKALLSMPHKGAYYYEFTLNGDKNEIYMDVYKKIINKVLPTDKKNEVNN